MSALTNIAEDRVLNHLCLVTAWTPQSPLKVALFTVTPGEAGGGTEVSGGAYARTNVTFSAASNGSITNSNDVVFPTATASWGTVVAIAIYDSASTPVMIWYGPTAVGKAVETGDEYRLPAGAITLTAD